MMEDVRIGIIGLDSSHAVEFTKILNNENHPFHVKGAKVVAATPYSSNDLPLSFERVKGFTEQVLEFNQVQLKGTVHDVVVESDALLVTSVDGRNRLGIFTELASYQKPIFIDKPLALSLQEAQSIISLSEKFGTPIMSTSSLRYAENLLKILSQYNNDITGLYLHGPLPLQKVMPGYFWYGIHMVEVIVTVLGNNIKKVRVETNNHYEWVVIEFLDGRLATIRGDRINYQDFGALIHTTDQAFSIDLGKGKPYYASLLEKIIPFFKTGINPISSDEMLSVIHLVETINKNRI